MFCSDTFAKKREALGDHVTDFSFILSVLVKLYHINMKNSAQEIGLSWGQPQILMSLASKDMQTQKELCEFIRIKPASMTDILKRMERDELIDRIRDEKDLRSIRVCITEKGREKFQLFIDKGSSIDDVALLGFTDEEKNICLHYLGRILENMNRDLNEKRENA